MNKCELCGLKDFDIILKAKDPDGITSDYYYLERCRHCTLCRVKGNFSYGFLSKFYSSDYYPEGVLSSLLFNFFSVLRLRKINRFKKKGGAKELGDSRPFIEINCVELK